MSTLFTSNQNSNPWNQPLAYLLRPKTLEEFFGQEEIVGEGKLLRTLIKEDRLHSVIFLRATRIRENNSCPYYCAGDRSGI